MKAEKYFIPVFWIDKKLHDTEVPLSKEKKNSNTFILSGFWEFWVYIFNDNVIYTINIGTNYISRKIFKIKIKRFTAI